MKIKLPCLIRETRGFATITLIGLILIIFITGSTLVVLTHNNSKNLIRSKKSNECLYLADGGIEKAIWEFTKDDSYPGETNTALGTGTFSISVNNVAAGRYELFSTASMPSGPLIVAKKIKAVIEKDPVSHVFDYCYFINNWGWYWGHDITACGDVRSNGRFDFVDGPKVEGQIYAGEEIDDHGTPIRGIGGDPANQHQFAEQLPMPNLQSLDYYEAKAFASSGTVVVNGATVINKVYGDDAGESGNIVLVGTSSKPIEISGTVVIRGDLVIKGKVTGQGTIYTGRNIYIADSLEYKTAPSSPRPAQGQTKDQWVDAHKDDDLVAYAAKGNIVLGDYTKDSYFGYNGSDQWYADDYLFGMPADPNEDGVSERSYNWSDIETQTAISNFANLPSGINNFSDLSSNSANKLDGIFYTNHAWAGRTGNAVQFNGSLISKDEAIIYRNGLTFNYDERAHSRYNSDPNRFIDLGLPRVRGVYLVSWQEIR
jgi:hypothetical protein